LSASDLALWQSNYGAGSAAPAGGGLDVLIANTGGDRAVDAALLDLASLSNGGATRTAGDTRGRLLLGTDGGIWNQASIGDLANDADPNVGQTVSDDVIVDGRIITAEDWHSVWSLPATGNKAVATRGEPISDDVIVDGRIITAENYDAAWSSTATGDDLSMSGQTIRLRIATTNNAGK
jgi:hypothetical protein